MLVKKIIPVLIVLLLPFLGMAQVTTSQIVGVVTSSTGAPIDGASIKATHTPSGTVYRTISRSGGNFTIPNMRVGGPYTIEVSYVGLQTQTYNDIYLQLGEDTKLTPVLIDQAQSLSDVTVATTKKNSLIGKDQMGTSVSISRTQMDMLPSITHSINDFARLSPIGRTNSSTTDGSPNGISFGGQNTRYNQFTIDGANATDIFGLASNGTNGGQTGVNPIPLDAIDQVQVILAPYDVTQSGFTGGGMNAVTRSGTNELHGSVYGFFQNQDMVGHSVIDGSKFSNFKSWQYGARLGGAIVKDKLFYFLDYEGINRTQPIANQPGEAGSASEIDMSTAQSLADFVKNKYGYDVGAINGINQTRKGNTFFGRIDWNINDKNKLMIRDNFVKASYNTISDGTSSLTYGNDQYTKNSKTNSLVAELNSNISSKVSNLLRVTVTTIREPAPYAGSPFPYVTISDNGATYNFGSNNSYQANVLNQNAVTLTDNLNLYLGKHTLTFGTDNMYYTAANEFIQNLFGYYSYNSIGSFEADTLGAINKYQVGAPTAGADKFARVKSASFSLYAQDAWNVTDNFKLTYGLRADMNAFLNHPPASDAFNTSDIASEFGVSNALLPKAKILVSPRVGFNWDVFGNSQTQIRGGLGLFTGRTPMVWVEDQYVKNGGATLSTVSLTAAQAKAAGITFSKDPNNQYKPAGTTGGEVDLTDRNFEAPRTFRTNLAIDQKLPWGIVGTIEGVYTKVVKDIDYRDLNLAPATMTLQMGDVTRPFFNSATVDPNWGHIVYLTNTSKGYAYNVYAKLEKQFSEGWMAMATYSLGHSYGVNDGTSSVATSNLVGTYGDINGLNALSEARNNNDQGSKVILMVGKRFKYGKFGTDISLFYNGESGLPFTYAFYGDVNGDYGSTISRYSSSDYADVMWVPNDASYFKATSSMTADQEYAAWQKYVASDKYLSSHVGQNLARNGSRLPWENHVDLHLDEYFNFIKSHTITLSVDIFNFGHMLDKNFGKSYYLSYQEIEPLDVAGFTQSGSTVKPQFTFNPAYGDDKYTGKPWTYSDFLSRWNMQVGLRYSF